jgi:hypothetical protein
MKNLKECGIGASGDSITTSHVMEQCDVVHELYITEPIQSSKYDTVCELYFTESERACEAISTEQNDTIWDL